MSHDQLLARTRECMLEIIRDTELKIARFIEKNCAHTYPDPNESASYESGDDCELEIETESQIEIESPRDHAINRPSNLIAKSAAIGLNPQRYSPDGGPRVL